MGIAGICFKLFANPANMHINGFVITHKVVAPNLVDNLVSGPDSSGLAHKQFQDSKFFRGKADLFSPQKDSALLGVESDIFKLQDGTLVRLPQVKATPAPR